MAYSIYYIAHSLTTRKYPSNILSARFDAFSFRNFLSRVDLATLNVWYLEWHCPQSNSVTHGHEAAATNGIPHQQFLANNFAVMDKSLSER